jgi:hypothetical protein
VPTTSRPIQNGWGVVNRVVFLVAGSNRDGGLVASADDRNEGAAVVGRIGSDEVLKYN